MRIPITYIRAALVAVNFILPAALAAHFFYNRAWPRTEPSRVEVYDLEVFKYKEDPRGLVHRGGSLENRMAAIADWLEPKKPKPPEPVQVGEKTGEPEAQPETPQAEEELDEGPLAENWEYVWGLYYENDPTRNVVMLRRKREDSSSSRPAASRITSRFGRRAGVTTVRSSSRSRFSRTRGTAIRSAPGETVTFQVKDRHFVNEDLELDFYIHSADEEKLVYWIDNPRRMYALPRVSKTIYGRKGREERLITGQEEKEEEGEEGEKKEEERHIVLVPADYEDLRERDYAELVKGNPGQGFLKPKKKASVKAQPVPQRTLPGGQTPAGVRRTPGTAPGGGVSRAGGSAPAGGAPPQPEPKSREEQIKELQKTLKDPRIPEKDRKELQKALDEALRGPSKR